jgi:small subunit ribosomal protein S4
VRVGDIVEIRSNKAAKKVFSDLADRLKTHTAPGWLHREEMKGKIVSLPSGEELKEAYDPTLIVEFYSMR